MNLWFWVLIALTVPTGLAIVVTLLYSVKGDPMIGATLGSGVVFASCVGLIGREYVELARLSERCLAAGIGCPVYPEPHVRFGIYCVIALLQVFAVFLLGQQLEEKARRRAYAPEWQR
jgi:hypothetical protein